VESLSVAQRKAFYEEQIEIGERLKKESMGDLFIIAALSGAYGARWIESEAIASLVQSVVTGTASLAEVAVEIGERLEQQSRS